MKSLLQEQAAQLFWSSSIIFDMQQNLTNFLKFNAKNNPRPKSRASKPCLSHFLLWMCFTQLPKVGFFTRRLSEGRGLDFVFFFFFSSKAQYIQASSLPLATSLVLVFFLSLNRVLLYRPGNPTIHDSPVSALQELRLQACTIKPCLVTNFLL